MTLQGQIALVTGASRGIGQAIALELGRQGATVIGTATSESGAQAITTYLDAAGILPTAEEVEDFLASKAPDKRVKLIDALLERLND